MGDFSDFQTGHFWCMSAATYVTKMATISCIQISSYQGYDDTQMMGGHHQLRGTVVENQN